jgi:hypothetical protein
LGYPREEVIDAARTVLGACLLLEEMGHDMVPTRLATVRQLERTGLRERDLVAPQDSIELRRRDMVSMESAQLAAMARGGSDVPPADRYLSIQELARRDDGD